MTAPKNMADPKKVVM